MSYAYDRKFLYESTNAKIVSLLHMVLESQPTEIRRRRFSRCWNMLLIPGRQERNYSYRAAQTEAADTGE